MNAPYQLLKVKKAENTCIALLENGRLLEYYQEDAQRDSIVGSIYLGRVERVLNAIEGVQAEVDLAAKTASITLEKDVADDVLAAAVTEAGFKVVSIA